MKHMRLGDLLLNVSLITQEQLNNALAAQKGSSKRLGEVLIEQGAITESQLIEALTMQLGIEFVDLGRVNIAPQMCRVLSKNIAKKHRVVPVRAEQNTLYLATADPLNFIGIEEVRSSTRMRVVPMMATGDAIDRAILTLYGNEGASRAIEEMKREARTVTADPGYTATAVDDDAQSAPTIRLVNSIIERAVIERASDIHLEPGEEVLQVRMRVDGLMRDILTVPRDLQQSVISRLKVMGGMDISERKIPQDGRTAVSIKQRDVDLRMSTLPTIFGEKFVIRLLDKNAQLLDKAAIGLEGHDEEVFDRFMSTRSGVLLIAGPTGSGKTSTMYTMMRTLNTREVNLVTLEDPVEYQIKGINQVQINEKTGMTFASGLRAILRQDPDIIAVGEIRDGETAQIAMRAAITGHLVLSTIHTSNAVATIDRLNDIGVEPYLTAGAVRGILSQRLVRRVCPHCRKPYAPTAQELQVLELPVTGQHTFYRGTGCPMCFHTGYRGRIGVFELLELTPGIRRAINEGASKERIRELAKQSGFVSLEDNARRLVREGITTPEEARRVMESANL